jgi:ribosomal protein S18 acetylase RimI-like enzyme
MIGLRSRYRSAGLLIGLVCLGWAWDFALGGGKVHAPAWVAALLVVAGISLLAARSGRAASAPSGPPPAISPAAQRPQPADAITIRPAVVGDLPVLIEVEVAADKLFEVAGYGKTPGPASLDELAAARLLLVAVPRVSVRQARTQPPSAPPRPAGESPTEEPSAGESPTDEPPADESPTDEPPADESPTEELPIGYIRVEVVDGQAHIEGLSVRPRQMRRGVGTALVSAACQWAAEQGFDQITLCTFTDVPWNGPFYARQGFREEPVLTPQLLELRQHEQRLGLDAMGTRCVMRKSLVAAAVAQELPTDQVGKE